ncbi:MAG: GTPase domain-containing protein [Desulfobacterales bacterium]|nr:GTPase domain-containing protein [Desulfobacterales bacterium]
MPFLNLKKMELQCKIVYYGPGRGGKTTSLAYIFKKFRNRLQTEMITIKTTQDRTLFFDFLPLEIGKISNYDVRIQLYTVPGQVKYNTSRKLILNGVDGVIFVADSRVEMRENNMSSLQNLQQNLKEYGLSIFKIPLVLQYNKRDLKKSCASLMSVDAMELDLNRSLKVPSFPSSAETGYNIIDSLKAIIKVTMADLREKGQVG